MITRCFEPELYRYEYKYKLTDISMHDVEHFVIHNPMGFYESYPPRHINNIYFDSLEMSNYFDNVIGVNERLKVRIRWYGDVLGHIEKPVLEFKVKRGMLSGKERFPLTSFTIDRKFTIETIRKVFECSHIPDEIKINLSTVNCTLLNHYERKYFENFDRKFRMTIDTNLQYYFLSLYFNTFLERYDDHRSLVLELKYSSEYDHLAQYVTQSLPFRISKSSKYVSGIEALSMW